MNNKVKNTAREFLCGKYFPLLLLFLMACTFAIQLPQLGFYLDDWVSIAAYDQGGEEGLLAFGVNDSRPFAAWITAKFFNVLGTGVLNWQLITLFWRYAAAITCFLLLSAVWPDQKVTAGFTALLFGIFPYFKHQAICIAYFMILMQYFVILLSFLLTVKALQTKNRTWKIILFLLSYLTSLFHLACLEYYLSLEAARLLLIYFVIKKRDNLSISQAIKKALLIYIPYILILASIVCYRFIYIPSLSPDVRPVNMFVKYTGLNIIWHFLGLFLQYLTESILGVWYRSINPASLDLTIHNTQLGLGLGIVCAGIVFILLRKSHSNDNEQERSRYEMLLLGTAALMLGFLPGMAIDSSPAANSNYNDRYLIPSFWGIAIFTITWISLAFKNNVIRNGLLSILICISVLFQIQNSFMYRYSWKYQQQFQWELKWRAPDIKENTAFVSDGVIASFMGGWADSSMVLEMYGKQNGINPTPYWYFNVGEDNYLNVLGTPEKIYIKSKMYEFQTDSENVLLITKPEYGKCLWVVDEADLDNPYLEDLVFQYIPYQNKSRIIPDSDYQFSQAIFGSGYTHDWCYYFENADRYFDLQKYDEVLRLFDEIQENNIPYGNPTEFRPFIKSAAFAGDWEKAIELTKTASQLGYKDASDYFENLWRIIDRDLPNSQEKADTVAEAYQYIKQGK